MRRPRPLDIIASVARHAGVHPSSILEGDRELRVVMARDVAALLMARLLGMSTFEIGAAMGLTQRGAADAKNRGIKLVDNREVCGPFDFCTAYLASMADLTRESPVETTATLYVTGGHFTLRSLANGAVQVTGSMDDKLDLLCNSGAEALAWIEAWRKTRERKDAA